MTKSEVEKKSWYRLVKVIYIIAFLLLFWIPTTITISSMWPTLDEYNSRYQYKCADGSIWGKSSEINGARLNWLKTDFNSYDEATINGAKIRCANTSTSAEELLKQIKSGEITTPPYKNYTIVRTEEVYTGSQILAISAGFGALLLSLLFFMLIRALFFYIISGSPFWKTLFWRKV